LVQHFGAVVVLQSESDEQSSRPAPALPQIDGAPDASDVWMQACPCAVWHIESDVQKTGQSAAAWQT
jgi:hypothetical protein